MREKIVFVLIVMMGVVFLIVGKFNFNRKVIFTKTPEDFRSVPYLAYTTEKAGETKSGVVKYIPEVSFEGYNSYLEHGGKVKIIDMQGNVIKEWQGRQRIGEEVFEILDNGDFILGVIDRFNEKGVNGHYGNIGRMDWFGRKIWEKMIPCHHDLSLTPARTILVLSKEIHLYMGRKVEFDSVIELSLEGEEISRWSTYENLAYLKKFHQASVLDNPKRNSGVDLAMPECGSNDVYDYYHLNSIQILPETPLGEKDKRFQEGNWLISLPRFDMVVILDKKNQEVVWTWGPGEIQQQHMPRMLDNGNILIFDNGNDSRRVYSRVIELDTVEKRIVWEYKANPPESFFSAGRGSVQRLPNGNTLIMESDRGRAFEVTLHGDIVWEWFNPKANEEGNRGSIYRMIRIPKEKIDRFLNQ